MVCAISTTGSHWRVSGIKDSGIAIIIIMMGCLSKTKETRKYDGDFGSVFNEWRRVSGYDKIGQDNTAELQRTWATIRNNYMYEFRFKS